MAASNIVDEPFHQVRPKVTDRNAHFWHGGADGVLRLLHCQRCRAYLHPPAPVCRSCRSMNVRPEALSGQGVVHAFTINRYQAVPGMEPPHVVGLVELVEQPGLTRPVVSSGRNVGPRGRRDRVRRGPRARGCVRGRHQPIVGMDQVHGRLLRADAAVVTSRKRRELHPVRPRLSLSLATSVLPGLQVCC